VEVVAPSAKKENKQLFFHKRYPRQKNEIKILSRHTG
jgi:hypothetical protein